MHTITCLVHANASCVHAYAGFAVLQVPFTLVFWICSNCDQLASSLLAVPPLVAPWIVLHLHLWKCVLFVVDLRHQLVLATSKGYHGLLGYVETGGNAEI